MKKPIMTPPPAPVSEEAQEVMNILAKQRNDAQNAVALAQAKCAVLEKTIALLKAEIATRK